MKPGTTCYFVNGRGEVEVGKAGGWTTNKEDSSAFFQITLDDGGLLGLSQTAVSESLFASKAEARKRALKVIDAYLCECLSKAEQASVYKQRLLRKEVP